MDPQGKIIVITGGPRVGKTTLVKKLSSEFSLKAFYDVEEKDISDYILDNLIQKKVISGTCLV